MSKSPISPLHPDDWPGPLRNALISLAVAATGALMASELQWLYLAKLDGVPAGKAVCPHILGALLWTAAFIAALSFAFARINRQNRAYTDTKSMKEIDSRPYLIAGFSKFHSHNRPKPERADPEAGGKYSYSNFDLEAAIGKNENANLTFGNWQQTLRLIAKLSDCSDKFGKPRQLRRVILIPNDQGQAQADLLLKILRRYFSDREIVFELLEDKQEPEKPYGQWAPIYGDAQAMQQAFRHAHEVLARDVNKSMRAVEAQTYIDITAGQKPFSVAAATYTFNRDLMIVYNPSGDESDGLGSYDTRLDFESFSGG